MIISKIDEITLNSIELPEVARAQLTEAEACLPKGSARAAQRRFKAAVVDAPIKAIPDPLLDAYIKYGNNADGIAALHAAIKAKDENAVRMFLDHGADPNAKTTRNWSGGPNTALDFAAAFGTANIVNLLIDRGAIVNPQPAPNSSEIQPLDCAAQYNNPETIRCLVRRGADLSGKNSYLGGAIFFAVLHNSVEAIDTLFSLGVSPNSVSVHGTLLAFGCSNWVTVDNTAAIELLLKRGANPNGQGTHGHGTSSVPLFNLMSQANFLNCSAIIKKAELLIQYGANINAKDWMGRTALYYASCIFAKEDLAEWLKAHGAVM